MKKKLLIFGYSLLFAQNYIFVHGLKSNADIFFKMAGDFNQTVVKIGVEHYNQNGTCIIPDGSQDKEVNCSEIHSNNTLAKVIYGLNDNFNTKFYFKEFNNTDTNLSMDNAQLYTNQKFNSNVFIVNLSNNINLSFEAQGEELKSVIDTISKKRSDNNFVLIGHSMGGIAIRSYLQYFYQKNQNINEVITIATPHKGVKYDIPVSVYGASAKNLEAGSKDLENLNSINLEIYKKIPFLAIISTGYDKSILYGDLISGANDDGIVSANSQKPPFDAKIIEVNDGIYHTHETNNIKIINLVKKYASDYKTIHNGWSLIGGNVEQFNLKPLNIAWKYNNGWKYYSNEYSVSYPIISEINRGFWINSNKARDFLFVESNTSKPLQTGWNLVKGEINIKNVKCNVQIAWKYQNGKWLIYPEINGYTTFDKVNKHEGAWILCENNITNYKYQKILKVGINVNWAVFPKIINIYNSSFPTYFAKEGFSTIRLRFDFNDKILNSFDNNKTKYINYLKQVANDCEANKLNVVLADGASNFKDNPNEDSLNELINNWILIANAFKNYPKTLSYNFIIEPGKELNQNSEILNEFYKKLYPKIRKIDQKRILLWSPDKCSNPELLNQTWYPKNDNYIMAEWHNYAAGPHDGYKEDIPKMIASVKSWEEKSHIPTWFGAWMPGDYNHGDDYNISYQIKFATFLTKELKLSQIPFAINADTQLFDYIDNKWNDRLPVVGAIMKTYTGD